jgi:hypothetical protein
MLLGRLRAVALVVLAALAGACSASIAQQEASSPDRVVDTERLTAWPGLVQQYGVVFVAYSVTALGEVRDHPFNYWRFMGEDSLFVGHPGALAGVSMELQVRGQDLHGVINSFSDVWEGDKHSTVTTSVRAHRVECPGNGR